MFERFTESARLWSSSPRRRPGPSINYIGTEHVLLGLLREEEGLAARVLASLEITLERARAQVVRTIPPGEEATSQIPLTPRSKKVLELALREAHDMRHDGIGTEHILLGLVREGEGVGMSVLIDCGADAEKVRERVLVMLGGPKREEPSEVDRVAEIIRAIEEEPLTEPDPELMRELMRAVRQRGRGSFEREVIALLTEIRDLLRERA
jgi:ATP-dependent Clp protease ATP-binding subunit ClpC